MVTETFNVVFWPSCVSGWGWCVSLTEWSVLGLRDHDSLPLTVSTSVLTLSQCHCQSQLTVDLCWHWYSFSLTMTLSAIVISDKSTYNWLKAMPEMESTAISTSNSIYFVQFWEIFFFFFCFRKFNVNKRTEPIQCRSVTGPHPWLVIHQCCIHISCQLKAKWPLITILSLNRL